MPVSSAYLAALAQQIGGLSAFLGGFAATALFTLIVQDHRGRAMAWAIGAATVAAVAFVVAVVASTMLVAWLHPQVPVEAVGSRRAGTVLMALSFAAGLYALLAAIALAGWVRSARTGRVTTGIAAVGAVLVTAMVVRVG